MDYIGLLIGLSCGEILNLLQGYISGLTGFSRLHITVMTLTLFISLIFYKLSNQEEEPVKENIKEKEQ